MKSQTTVKWPNDISKVQIPMLAKQYEKPVAPRIVHIKTSEDNELFNVCLAGLLFVAVIVGAEILNKLGYINLID